MKRKRDEKGVQGSFKREICRKTTNFEFKRGHRVVFREINERKKGK